MKLVKWLLEIIALENLTHECTAETCVVNKANSAHRTCRVCGQRQMLIVDPGAYGARYSYRWVDM